MPGVPGILIGKSREVAWGFTVLFSDSADLYRESIKNNTHYLVDGKWYALNLTHEIIKVRGSADVELAVANTHRGPIVDFVFDKMASPPITPVQASSLASLLALHTYDHNTYTGFIAYQLADNA